VASNGHHLPHGQRIVATPMLSGLRHEYLARGCSLSGAINDICGLQVAWPEAETYGLPLRRHQLLA